MRTNFPNGITSYGIPVTGSIPLAMGTSGVGDVYFVDATNGSDGNDGLSPTDAFKTISQANDAVLTNNHDTIALSANSAHAVTEMLTVSKNRVHYVGLDGRTGIGMGARARVTQGVTTAATDIAVMKNTGVGNTFEGIKFDSSNTVAEGLYGVVEAGEYAVYNRCEIYKSTDLDDAGASELALNGDSAQFLNSTIGSTVNETGNIRANVLCTGGIVSGKKLRDCYFENCMLLAKADDTDKVFVYGANATDVERSLTFKSCTFFNNPLSAGTPAAAIAFGAAQTQGAVFCDATTAVVDVTVMGTTGQNIFVIQQDGATYATAGLSAQA